jgi:hypothetical protein
MKARLRQDQATNEQKFILKYGSGTLLSFRLNIAVRIVEYFDGGVLQRAFTLNLL